MHYIYGPVPCRLAVPADHSSGQRAGRLHWLFLYASILRLLLTGRQWPLLQLHLPWQLNRRVSRPG